MHNDRLRQLLQCHHNESLRGKLLEDNPCVQPTDD
jgi:hypothetical protein